MKLYFINFMYLSQKCICFPDNIPDSMIENFINEINQNNTIIEDVNKYPLESVMIFGIIILMIIVFFVISKCLKNNTINPYSKNNEQNNLNISQDSDNI